MVMGGMPTEPVRLCIGVLVVEWPRLDFGLIADIELTEDVNESLAVLLLPADGVLDNADVGLDDGVGMPVLGPGAAALPEYDPARSARVWRPARFTATKVSIRKAPQFQHLQDFEALKLAVID